MDLRPEDLPLLSGAALSPDEPLAIDRTIALERRFD
jgi:hypothetical protein